MIGQVAEEGLAGSSGNFVFEGDGDEVEDDAGEETKEDSNAEAGPSNGGPSMVNDAPEEEQDGEEEEGEGDVPEDDYNAAWEVLDVARTIYSKIVGDLPEGEGRDERLCLADCYLSLGDVSLETGKLTKASSGQS